MVSSGSLNIFFIKLNPKLRVPENQLWTAALVQALRRRHQDGIRCANVQEGGVCRQSSRSGSWGRRSRRRGVREEEVPTEQSFKKGSARLLSHPQAKVAPGRRRRCTGMGPPSALCHAQSLMGSSQHKMRWRAGTARRTAGNQKEGRELCSPHRTSEMHTLVPTTALVHFNLERPSSRANEILAWKPHAAFSTISILTASVDACARNWRWFSC